MIRRALVALLLLTGPAWAQQTVPDLIPGGVFNSVAPTLSNYQKGVLQLDSSGNLKVNIAAGAAVGGTSSNFNAAFPTAGTAIGVKNGTNMVNLNADNSGNLDVNCSVGCSVGSFNNNSDAVATSATNGQSAAWLYGFNGTTFDRLRVDGSKNLNVDLQTALPAGANQIGSISNTSFGISGTLPAYAAIPAFKIDQTTPGTTNGVQVNAALPAGTNNIGGVELFDSGGTNKASISAGGAVKVDNSGVTQPISGTVTANQGTANATPWNENVAQINGVAPLMGNGTTGTGSPRVTVSSDNTAVGNWGQVATGAAPPASAVYLGANASGATGGHVAGLIQCDNHVFKHITSATDTLAVQGVASQTIYICGWRSRAAGVATWFLENTASTNANCSSANTQITGVATEAANTGETMLAPFWTGLKNTSGNGLCINSTGTGGVDVDIWYTQF